MSSAVGSTRNPRSWNFIHRLCQKFCLNHLNFKLYSNIKSYSKDKLYSIVRLYSNVKIDSKVQLYYSHVELCIFQCLSNNRFLRERGMASNPKMEYQIFLCIFQNNSAMATLGLKEMGKFLWEGREKGLPCWLSQFSKTKLRQPTFLPTFPKGIFPFPSNLR